MNKKIKRTLEILLSLAMIFSLMPTSVFATLSDGTAFLGNVADGDIITFGSYPQSKVTDSATITALNNATICWRYIPLPFRQDRSKSMPIWQERFCIFLPEFTSILEIANLLILATRHLWWQQTQKSTGFWFNSSGHKKAATP